MENILRKPYEISLWDDDLTFKVTYLDSTGKQVAEKEYIGSLANFESIEGTTTEIVQYYKERKICVIGSNTMDTPIRATSGKLVSNVNGSNTLTFNMYSRYYDEEADEFYDNPFLKLLVNERKVKLRYGAIGSADCEWYDFIIKDIKENSENKTFSYTCKDLFVNELSKSGFNIQLDPELENNMGNITYLAERVLDESDWRLGANNAIISQTKEEPLYEVKLSQSVTAYDMKTKEQIDIDEEQTIYAFYNIIANQEPYFQFVYCADGKYEVDDDHVITNSPNYFIENVKYDEEGLPTFASHMNISSTYRGDKLIRQAVTLFDSTIDRYVNVYEKDKTEYYGYTKSEYITPTAVQTFITQGEGFSSDSGWEVGGYWEDENGSKVEYPTLELVGLPDPRDIDIENWADVENYRSFLKFNRTHNDQILFNSGFGDHRSAINSLAVGEKFVIRAKISEAKTINQAGRPVEMQKFSNGSNIEVLVAEYTLDHGKYNLGTTYFKGSFEASEGDWFYTSDNKQIVSKVSKSKSDLTTARVGIFFETPLDKDVYFENVQFFRYIEYDKPIKNNEGEITGYKVAIAEPGGELFSAARTKYIYYLPNPDYKSEDDMIPEYDSYIDSSDFVKKYNENQFEKIRSITASESNRFNMIQDLCEVFECWAKFEIEHNPQTGEILLDDEYRQKKWITFHEYIGKDNYAGFRYGINLKSIQRTLNSDGIVSKIVVKNNANEFAPNGFCSISRAMENPTGENFILSFDYYIQQGLIDFSEVNNDLYLDVNGYIGYYKKLKRLNQEREAQIDLQSKLLTDISQYEANYKTYKTSVESAQEELRNTEIEIERLTGLVLDELKEDENNSWWEDTELITKVNKVAQLNSLIRQHSKLRDLEQTLDTNGLPIAGRLYEAEKQFSELEDYIKNLADEKRALNLRFYKKYSRFIQEGSWISEDYTDDNLYYLDAESTLFTSAQPKVTYTINVLELSQLEGYENYTFALGDKTYIEDTEFFGWVWSENGVKTPYHEEIVVSEFTVELDSPEKNTFKVQNFKTQFEDLFQRITATTQSVEYHTGEYNRTSSVIQTDGTIAAETLQNSMTNNAIRLENAKDQSVVWDETGITTTSLSSPNEIVRIVSGGIFLSTDGGVTWSLGISGSGINANFLTTGQINTASINIMNGKFPSFRWDSKGLSAFEFSLDENGRAYGFNNAKFVRYDQYGIYGINGHSGFEPKNEDEVWDNANFALTWKGFMLKNDEGSVSITSDKDIQVLSNSQERIKIGRLSTLNNNTTYGIRISNADGAPVMETDDFGELWLKNRLRVGTSDTSTVEIGYLDAVREKTDFHEVIHAGNGEKEFIVYEDGKMVAQGAEFHGSIYAESGKIGNMTIGDVEDAVNNMGSIAEATKKLDIQSNLGYNFRVENGLSSPLQLELVAIPTAFSVNEDGISWFGSNDFETWSELSTNTDTYTLTYEHFKNNQLNLTYCIRAVATATDGTSYEDWATIMSVSNGEKGEDALSLVITSSGGNYFRNNQGSTVLTARLFKAGQEIDMYEPYDYTYIWSDANDLSWTRVGKTLTVTADDVNFSRTYVCNVSQGG